jgi:hypothetical protein
MEHEETSKGRHTKFFTRSLDGIHPKEGIRLLGIGLSGLKQDEGQILLVDQIKARQ